MRVFGLTAGVTALALAATAADANAVPSFTRQTGMTCNQCHVSFGGPVPNFTFTGKKFRMNGYRVPFTADKIEAGEPGSINGRRMTLPTIPYLSFRYQSVFAQQSKAPEADKAGPIISNPTSRLSFFPGGAFGDYLGMWVELYLTTDGSPTQEWTQGLFSYDEYDLRFVKVMQNATLGFAFNNQGIREISGFGPWPVNQPSAINRGGFQGWSHPNRGNFFLYGWFRDQLLATIGASPGEDNLDWDRYNYQAQLAFAPLHSDANEAWINVITQFGNDGLPIVTNVAPTGTRTWVYRDAIQGLSAARGAGTQSAYLATDLGDFFKTEAEVRYGFVDKGPHSMETAVRYTFANEDYADNAKSRYRATGAAFRYVFQRTYGLDLTAARTLDWTYTDPTGMKHDTPNGFTYSAIGSFRPAMNVILGFTVSNSNIIRLNESRIPTGWNWSLNADILF